MHQLINPFEGAIYLAATMIGGGSLLLDAPSTSVLSELWPAWGLMLYYVALFMGGLVALCCQVFCMYVEDRPTAVRGWRAGCLLIASAWGSYGLALIALSPGGAITSGAVLTVIAIAALFRFIQLRSLE